MKSGGMITVTAALNQGRDVFAVPAGVGHSGAEGRTPSCGRAPG